MKVYYFISEGKMMVSMDGEVYVAELDIVAAKLNSLISEIDELKISEKKLEAALDRMSKVEKPV